ncbi:50S ribosomal protein L31e [Candidatus Pacearchaeota archaeon]|nr:50S ribosomal protein L31e [Candidatus Pacearchaeota archaeon]
MADQKTNVLEREYVIPLRKEFLKVPQYRRAGRAIKTIKAFIAKHMKVQDRDVSKVKLDMYLNNEMWFRGRRKPLSKVKVKARKEGDIVKVELAEMPKELRFLKLKHAKRHKRGEKKEAPKTEEKPVEEAKTEEEKKVEQEKEKSVAEQNVKIAEQQVKVQKHLSKVKSESHHRMALKK